MLISAGEKLEGVLHSWTDDAVLFLRHDLPKVVFVTIVAFILIRVLKVLAAKITKRQLRRLPSGVRMQQVRTVAGVITNIGVFVIVFVAALEVLPLLGLNLGPILASAGIVGLALGFGAQTLAHDFINGFFILLNDQYDIGDEVRMAGVQGTVEEMTLRHTTLRGDDGTIHIVPNSQATVVSNMSRDWSQLTVRVVVAYAEDSDRIVKLLQQVGDSVRNDPKFAKSTVGDVQVPGIDRVGDGAADYLILAKTVPTDSAAVSCELQSRVKKCFEENGVQLPWPGKVLVMEQGKTST